MASQRPNVHSQEWMTLPTMSITAKSNVNDEPSMEDVERISSEVAQTRMGADDIEKRTKFINTMRTAISSRSNPATTTTIPISAQDASLFLSLYKNCFPSITENENSNTRSMSLLKQEMMIQILEDYGRQLMDEQLLDPVHMDYLKKTIFQLNLDPGNE